MTGTRGSAERALAAPAASPGFAFLCYRVARSRDRRAGRRLAHRPARTPPRQSPTKKGPAAPPTPKPKSAIVANSDPANAGIRREPGLPEHEEIVAQPAVPRSEFEFGEGEADADAARHRRLQERMSGAARQASLDPDDGIAL